MKTIWRYLILTKPRIGYIFLGAVEVFWGLWFLNPIFQTYLNSQSLHFDPPAVIGVFAVVLGAATIYANIKSMTFGRTFFGILHVIFWSYVTALIGFGSWLSSGIPLYIIMVFMSMFLHVLLKLGEE